MRYEVTALSGSAQLIRLDVDAGDAAHAQRETHERGYRVISVRAVNAWPRWSGRAARFPLLPFAQELCALLAAGLGLVESIQTLADKEERPAVRRVLHDVVQTVSDGEPRSAALRAHATSFPPLFVATVRAAERTGDLPEALARFVAYRTQIDEVRKKIVGALIYPVLLLAVGTLVTLFLLAYVVPRFAAVYEDAGHDLPFLSELLLVWGRFFEAHWSIVLGALVLGVAGGALALHRSSLGPALTAAVWRIPAVGDRLRVYQLARLYRTLGMLLQSGLPIVAALKQSSDMLPPQLQPRLALAIESVGTGQLISAAMHDHGLTTPVALRMLRVGERSGRMSELMGRIATFHEDEMARAVEWFTRLFEPILMLAIGAVIGLIVLMMYVPVFDLAGTLQ